MSLSKDLANLSEGLPRSERMPIVFLGHGSPMNAIEDNDFSPTWIHLGKALPRPKAILVISAHWMTRGRTLIDASAQPRTIHDFHGFPDELFAQRYPAPGQPELAREVAALLAEHQSTLDESWGLDHGAWTLLKFLYPEADIPVFQVSIDMSRDLAHQLEIGQRLSELRERGVLLLGSGNVVHNLRSLRWGKDSPPQDFASDFDRLFADRLSARDFAFLANRQMLGPLLNLAHPSVDHYLPALTIAGASNDRDELTFMTERIDLGSISMRSFVFYEKSRP